MIRMEAVEAAQVALRKESVDRNKIPARRCSVCGGRRSPQGERG